jgi:hypothetical protein
VEHKEDVKKVAERLLALETISQHDIAELVGARPFASDVRGDACLRTCLAIDHWQGRWCRACRPDVVLLLMSLVILAFVSPRAASQTS